MKKLLILTVGLLVLTAPVAFAGVDGTPHDLGSATVSLCESCHVPHSAVQDGTGGLLWAQDTTGVGALGMTVAAGLCYTCHKSGGDATTGYEIYNAGKANHSVSTSVDCSSETGTPCHDVHDNTNDAFMTVSTTGTDGGTYCEQCHDDTDEGTLGDHTAGQNHTYTGITCNGCHTPHDGAIQSQGVTKALLADNWSGDPGYWGAFCISCHAGTAPSNSMTGYGGVAPTGGKIFDYEQGWVTDGAVEFHPTTSLASEGTATPVDGCDKCHDIHEATQATPVKYILIDDNTNSAYCVSCHALAGAPTVGNNTHYTGSSHAAGMNTGTSPFLPWSDELQDDGNADGVDWASPTQDMMICETCHSVHRLAEPTASGGAYALRDNYDESAGLCNACHTDN